MTTTKYSGAYSSLNGVSGNIPNGAFSKDYEANYSSYLANTVTSFPSTESGSNYGADIIFAIDANISSTDDGILVEYGGIIAGFAVGVSNGTLRARCYYGGGNFDLNETRTAALEADISSYTGSDATYYVVHDVSLSTLTAYVQRGGRNSFQALVELGSGTRTTGSTVFTGNDSRGYGQISNSIASLDDGATAYDQSFTGTIDEVRVYGDNSTDFTENFGSL